MPLKLFKHFVNQVMDIVDADFGIMDEMGTILACSNRKKEGSQDTALTEIIDNNNRDYFVHSGVSYARVYIRNRIQFIAFIESEDPSNKKILDLISINIKNLKTHYDEKYDKANLMKNIIMDNILPGDIALRAKELHMDYNSKRVVFLIKTESGSDVYSPEVVQNLFPDKAKDFVIIIDDVNIVLVKQLRENDPDKEIKKIADVIVDTLNTELMVKAMVSIGTISNSIQEIGRSYKEAQTAMLVGGIFENDKLIVHYNNLGLGRLIYQLPTTLCRLFLNEVFKEGAYESLDQETLLTIQKFFENNLNVSETARQLYVHRNTLVYRLDKIKKLTGLDLREFDHAIIFKVSMLVKKYLDKGNDLY